MTVHARPWPWVAKGHGTGNDFIVILDDQDAGGPGRNPRTVDDGVTRDLMMDVVGVVDGVGVVDVVDVVDDVGQPEPASHGEPEALIGWLSPRLVRALCDRRTGIGADGVLRAVRAAGSWFMDHRNADGSTSRMCGNGVRVLARWLADSGLVPPGELQLRTRGGVVVVHVPADPAADISVDMGSARISPEPIEIEQLPMAAQPSFRPDASPSAMWTRPAVGVWCPNPHAVVWCDGDPALLGDIGSSQLGPRGRAVFPDGANIEFVQQLADDRVRVRVNERGVGETQSCGTGAVAVAVLLNAATGAQRVQVELPGGVLVVTVSPASLRLHGPAVIVWQGAVTPQWRAVHGC